jgi:MinD superfamily P-loop ATPase
VKYAEYTGSGCSGCAICFYTCPEPYAIEIHTVGK